MPVRRRSASGGASRSGSRRRSAGRTSRMAFRAASSSGTSPAPCTSARSRRAHQRTLLSRPDSRRSASRISRAAAARSAVWSGRSTIPRLRRRARTVAGHHLRPPWAVGTPSLFSARAMALKPRPAAYAVMIRCSASGGIVRGRPVREPRTAACVSIPSPLLQVAQRHSRAWQTEPTAQTREFRCRMTSPSSARFSRALSSLRWASEPKRSSCGDDSTVGDVSNPQTAQTSSAGRSARSPRRSFSGL